MTVRTKDLHQRLADCMLADRARFARQIRALERPGRRGSKGRRKPGSPEQHLAQLADRIDRAAERKARRDKRRPNPTYPDLPVSDHRDEIRAAIEQHQVVVVCGETGSGKTTQLPKICLEAGRGSEGLIAHTQPRRIAARSVAARIAEELGTTLGDLVGAKVRFDDRTSADTLIKLMTDGILLAETQGDRELLDYDTIIVDEAHERSLNIDFLLGYLTQLLPKRADLKLVITSATIDPRRFADHFEKHLHAEVPVIEVPGRTYPVETRYRPLTEDGTPADPDTDLVVKGVELALDEIDLDRPAAGSSSDVLIFMPGEREIRETAHALRDRYHDRSGVEILPLYARLSPQEQQRIFKPHRGRRIVIATNVAETSLTVPGIRYVIDPGLARISRYSARTKVQGLPTEPVSQASANQRKGRCGRVGPGVCYRLYDEEDFNTREEFTQPEILRTNLASVVLQMAALKLGRPERFPFVEPPDDRLIRDGYQTLTELGAATEDNEITELGRAMARLPIDPRVGRMILAANDESCLAEMLIIAAGLSVQDPRVRPTDKRDAADQAHAFFAKDPEDETKPKRKKHEPEPIPSDFMALLRVWHFWHNHLRPLSRSNRRKACDRQFLSELRLREWGEVVKQLRQVTTELGFHPNTKTADEDNLHRALLAGLLTNIGKRDDSREYLAVRNQRFMIHPGSNLKKARPQWIMTAELVRTTQLFARTCAPIDPVWIERLGGHLLKKTHADPHWDPKSRKVLAWERATLYGLEVVPKRRVHYGKVNPTESRELFIFNGLVEAQMDTSNPSLLKNRQLEATLHTLENKARRRDLLAEAQARYAFYDKLIPADVYTGQRFDRWYKRLPNERKSDLLMTLDDLMINQADVKPGDYPDEVDAGGATLPLEYRFEPGHERDGVTLDVPVELLGKLDPDRAERIVPALLAEKTEALLRTLPKHVRRHLDAARDARALAERVRTEDGGLLVTLAQLVSKKTGATVRTADFRIDELPQHLRLNVRVLDEHGKPIAEGRDLGALRAQLKGQIKAGFTKLAADQWTRDNVDEWDFGDLPDEVTIKSGPLVTTAYPAVVDLTRSAGLRLFDTRETADAAMRLGLARLFIRPLKRELKLRPRDIPSIEKIRLHWASLGKNTDIADQIMLLVADRVFVRDDTSVRTDLEFEGRVAEGWNRMTDTLHEAAPIVESILANAVSVRMKLESKTPDPWRVSVQDMTGQLNRLLAGDFLFSTPYRWLRCYPRFIQAMARRLDRLRGGGSGGVDKDRRAMAEVFAWEQKLAERAKQHAAQGVSDPAFWEVRWMLEEHRVSLFAQELKTSVPVSPKRLEQLWERVRT
ncbi:MAG: ATP-dependent RNA helicase HrpA [Planctomycetota bacterium]